MLSEQIKQDLIKAFSNSYTAESLGKLIEIFGSKQLVYDSIINQIPTSNSDIIEVMSKSLLIAFERYDKQQAGDAILAPIKGAEIILGFMKQALEDIRNGRNIEKWKKNLDESIIEIDIKINAAKGKNEPFESMEAIKNDVFYLKYLIKELEQ